MIIAVLVASLLMPVASADRCVIPTTDVDVYGPGQKAIIAWNGERERLILSTDLYASVDTRVIEVLPLPSEPVIEEGSFESFEAIQRLMTEHVPRAVTGGPETKGLEIIFHERIGAHDITVVKATSLEELLRLMLKYAQANGLSQGSSVNEETRAILEDYLARGYNYWVFDLVDVYSAARTVEPIVYEFQTASLYYPLKVSATTRGAAEIVLYLISTEQIAEDVLPSGMRVARYMPNDQPIQFQVSNDDLARIEKGVASLFPVPLIYPTPAAGWFTAVKYEGNLSDLDFDLEIPKRPAPQRSIAVSTDKTQYDLGETVTIVVDFTHMKRGYFEIQVLHTHEIRIEVIDSGGTLIQTWRWKANDDLHREVAWKPNRAGEYLVRASSWWDGQKLEVEDQTPIAVMPTSPETPSVDREILWLIYGVVIAVTCVLVGAGLTYLLLRKPSTT